MGAARFTAVTFRDTYPQESVADHEVLMAFDGDSDAISFRQWWEDQGAEVFAVWLKAGRERGGAGDDNDKLTPSILAGITAADLGELKDGPPYPLPGVCPRCRGQMAHYRLKGYVCSRCH